MTTPLAEVIALSERATPGEWLAWKDEGGDYAKIDVAPDGPNVANTGRLTWPRAIEDAEFIAALVNWFRKNCASMRDEGRDAERYRGMRDALVNRPDKFIAALNAANREPKTHDDFDATIDAALTTGQGDAGGNRG